MTGSLAAGLLCPGSMGGRVAATAESLNDLLVNMHENLMCKDFVKSKCFDEEG